MNSSTKVSIAFIALSAAMLIVTSTVTLTATGLVKDVLNIFDHILTETWDRYSMPYAPAKWVYGLSVICIIMEAFIVVYGVYSIFATGLDNKKIVADNQWIRPAIYVLVTIAATLYLFYIIAWDNQRYYAALILIVLLTIVYYYITFLITKSVKNASEFYVNAGRWWQVYLMDLFNNNAAAGISTCFTIDTISTMSVVFSYSVKSSEPEAIKNMMVMFCTAVLLTITIAYVIVDAMVMYSQNKCTFNILMPYIILIVYVSAILQKHFILQPVIVMLGITMIISLFMLIIKFVIILFKRKKYTGYHRVAFSIS